VTPAATLLNTTPCTTAVAKFTLSNPLDFTENYFLDINILNDHVTLSQDSFVLPPKKTVDVFAYFNPTCDIFGEFNGSIDIETEFTELQASVPVSINIERKYDFNVETDNVSKACNYLFTQIPIKIKNNENFTNNFSLVLTKSKWFKLTNESIEVLANQEKIVYINAFPEWAETSLTELDLSVISVLGQLQYDKRIIIDVSDCYNPDIIIESEKTICSNNRNLELLLKNSGTNSDKTFNVKMDPDTVAKVENISYDLDIGENLTVPITLEIEDKDSKYKFDVIASVFDGIFSETKNAKINVKSLKNCYKTDIDSPLWIKTLKEKNAYNVTLTNIGISIGVYDLSIDGPGWINISETIIVLEPEESVDIQFLIDPTEVENKSLFKTKLKLVETSSNATYQKKVYFYVTQKTVWQTIKGWFNFTKSVEEPVNETVVNESVNVSMTEEQVTEPVKKEIRCEDRYDKELCDSDYFFMMEINSELIIDASNYIFDPDNDTIIIDIVSVSENVTLKLLEDNEISVIPKTNFTGFVDMQIKATDSKNSSVLSPLFIVQVKEHIEFSNVIQLVLLIVLLLLIIFIVFTVTRTEKDEKDIRHNSVVMAKPIKKKTSNKKTSKKTKAKKKVSKRKKK